MTKVIEAFIVEQLISPDDKKLSELRSEIQTFTASTDVKVRIISL